MSILERYEKAHDAFSTGSVLTDSNEKLVEYLSGLSNQNNVNTGTQHRDIIRGITINHILLQRHIDALNKQNAKTQMLVIVLAIAALLSSVVQIISPVFFQGEPTASIQRKQEAPVATTNQEKPPTSSPAISPESKHGNLLLSVPRDVGVNAPPPVNSGGKRHDETQ